MRDRSCPQSCGPRHQRHTEHSDELELAHQTAPTAETGSSRTNLALDARQRNARRANTRAGPVIVQNDRFASGSRHTSGAAMDIPEADRSAFDVARLGAHRCTSTHTVAAQQIQALGTSEPDNFGNIEGLS